MSTPIAIGIMAFNEEGNIAHLLDSVLAQTVATRISRIVVVASGCTDRTCDIVADYGKRDRRIQLVTEAVRGGKVSAINTFLSIASEPILLVSAADIVLQPDTVERLTAPFEDDKIGMVGAHPIPMNRTDHFAGFAVNLMWQLHHQISLAHPKMGELVAFRNVFKGLDPTKLADEVQLEYGIRAVGYAVTYAPDAIVLNRGPETVREFVAQRTRWNSFNMQMQREHRLPVATMQLPTVLKAAYACVIKERPRLDWLGFTALLECYSRIRGALEYPRLRSPRTRLWNPQKTTKVVVHAPDERAAVAPRAKSALFH